MSCELPVTQPLKLVIVEDEDAHFQLMKRAVLREFPLAEVCHFSDAAECLRGSVGTDADVLVLDYLMPGMTGLEFLEALGTKVRDVPVVMITGQGDESTAVRAMKLGAWDYLVKSADFFKLLPGTIEKVVRERRLRDSLRLSQRRFRDLAESTSDWIWEIDSDGRFVYSNPTVERVIGYSPGLVLGMEIREIFATEDNSAALDFMFDGRPVTNFGCRARHQDGHEVYLETSGVPVLEAGALVGYRGIGRDISRRKRAQASLRESEEKFRSIFNESPIGISICNQEGKVLDANKACLEIFGLPGLSGFADYNIFRDPGVPASALEAMREGKTARCVLHFDFDRACGDTTLLTGRTGRVFLSMQMTRLQGTSYHGGYLLQFKDITIRKRAEEALRSSHRLLEISNRNTDLCLLLDEFVAEVKRSVGCSAVAVRLLDEDGRIPYQACNGFSESFCELESPLSIHTDRCMCVSVIRGEVDAYLQYHTPVGSFVINGTSRFLASLPEETRALTRNNCNRFGYESVALVPIRRGQSTLGLIHVADEHENMISQQEIETLEGAAMGLGTAIQRIRAMDGLQKAHAELEKRVDERTAELGRANRLLRAEVDERRKAQDALLKSTEELKVFAYSVMHDLKSPAIATHGLTRLLDTQYGDLLDERGHTYCEQILKASEFSCNLVDDINTYIMTREAPLRVEPLRLEEILSVVRGAFIERLNSRGIRLIVPSEDVVVAADKLCLVRVLNNFLENALKYGGESLSEIRICCTEHTDESGAFHDFSVSDNGVGISAEECEGIFGTFERKSTSKGIEGSGLGLAIVREVARRHQGRVWVEPGPDRGTSFHITIAKELRTI